ncbi:MAG: hypothetical protein ACOC9T_00550 [Myxococcota bacterium]
MSAKIRELVDKVDNVELLRDEVAAILAVESESQRALAAANDGDPEKWRVRVFTERARPFEFLDAPDGAVTAPIVNVAIDNMNYDESGSDVFHRQKTRAVYHIDCYGNGRSSETPGGHEAADEIAAKNCQRGVRLVRNFLMAAEWRYLGHRGLVWQRWIDSVQFFQVPTDQQMVEAIVAARIQFAVTFNEFSPQYQPETLEILAGQVLRAETGEVYFNAHFESSE